MTKGCRRRQKANTNRTRGTPTGRDRRRSCLALVFDAGLTDTVFPRPVGQSSDRVGPEEWGDNGGGGLSHASVRWTSAHAEPDMLPGQLRIPRCPAPRPGARVQRKRSAMLEPFGEPWIAVHRAPGVCPPRAACSWAEIGLRLQVENRGAFPRAGPSAGFARTRFVRLSGSVGPICGNNNVNTTDRWRIGCLSSSA